MRSLAGLYIFLMMHMICLCQVGGSFAHLSQSWFLVPIHVYWSVHEESLGIFCLDIVSDYGIRKSL